METMKSWMTDLDRHSVAPAGTPVPQEDADEVLVKVLACGVCRTDLHLVDGELAPHRAAVTPGHQIVGTVVRLGSAGRGLQVGDLVGIAWLRRTCGACTWCRSGRENLCPDSQYTGWDADGGFAEYATVPAAFAYPLAAGSDPVETAPLLCAGIIGYRALSRAALPRVGGSASTVSGRVPTSRPNWPWLRERRSSQ